MDLAGTLSPLIEALRLHEVRIPATIDSLQEERRLIYDPLRVADPTSQ